MATEPKLRIMSWRARIVLALLLGGATTLAVAVLAALFPVEDWLGLSVMAQVGVVLKSADNRLWQVEVRADRSPSASCAKISLWPATAADADAYPVIAPGDVPPFFDDAARRCIDLGILKDVTLVSATQITVYRFGWPARALEWRERQTVINTSGTLSTPVRTGALELTLPAIRWVRYPAVVPYIVRWSEFAEDVGAYSCVWLALLLLPRIVRAMTWRVWRRCPVCGYDRRGIDVAARCPECGAAGGERVAA